MLCWWFFDNFQATENNNQDDHQDGWVRINPPWSLTAILLWKVAEALAAQCGLLYCCHKCLCFRLVKILGFAAEVAFREPWVWKKTRHGGYLVGSSSSHYTCVTFNIFFQSFIWYISIHVCWIFVIHSLRCFENAESSFTCGCFQTEMPAKYCHVLGSMEWRLGGWTFQGFGFAIQGISRDGLLKIT